MTMSWASRRRFVYLLGIFVFFGVVVGIPAVIWLYETPSCFDGKQNQGETAVDKGGPCLLLDERMLSPAGVLWSRSFRVRGGLYSAVAYIENPNSGAGVRSVNYRFGLYDEKNVLVAERTGSTYIMPGGITPVFEGAIDTGNRSVARTYFSFTSPLVWKRMEDTADALVISSRKLSATDSFPRLEAVVENSSVASILNPLFVAVVFDAAGNAYAASQTTVSRLIGGERGEVVFTWPDPFPRAPGRIDITPVVPPQSLK